MPKKLRRLPANSQSKGREHEPIFSPVKTFEYVDKWLLSPYGDLVDCDGFNHQDTAHEMLPKAPSSEKALEILMSKGWLRLTRTDLGEVTINAVKKNINPALIKDLIDYALRTPESITIKDDIGEVIFGPPAVESEISCRADALLNRLLKEKVSDHDLAPEYDLGDGYKLSFVGGQWYNNAYREGEFLTPDGTVAGTLFLGHRVSNDLLPPWWVDAVEIYDQFRGHGLFRRALMALRRDINITSDIRGHSSEPAIKAWKSVGGAELKKRPRFSARPLYMLRRKAQP